MSATDGSAIADVTSETIRQLDRPRAPDEIVSNEDVTEPPKMSRLLTRILAELALLRRRFYPRRVDFQDFDFGAGVTHRFPHGIGGRVRWWLVDQDQFGAQVAFDSESDADTLVLGSLSAFRGTLRIEEAG